jgi:hypothetical protein
MTSKRLLGGTFTSLSPLRSSIEAPGQSQDNRERYSSSSLERERLVVARDKAREVKTISISLVQTPNQRAASAAFNATGDTGRSAANNAAAEAGRAVNVENHKYCDKGLVAVHRYSYGEIAVSDLA